MKSKQYWEERAIRNALNADENAVDFYKRVKEIYQQSMNDIESEINRFYLRYGLKGKIEYTDVLKSLTRKEIKAFRKQSKAWANIAKENKWVYEARYSKLWKRLRINRLEMLKAQIQFNLDRLYEFEYNLYKKELPQQYTQSIFTTNYDIQVGTGIGFSFDLPNEIAINKAINFKFNEENYSSALWGRRRKDLIKLKQILPQGFIQGKSPYNVAKEIKQAVGGKEATYYQCERLARTEMLKIANEGTYESYKESGIVERYEYIATLDNRTSTICADMDGKIFPISQKKIGINYPPLHPNCRSTTGTAFDSDELYERVAKDKTGKYYEVSEGMKFKDWFKTLDKEHQSQFKNLSNKYKKQLMEE